uniref:Vigilin n=1 Tax=Hadrurus spadix TaxID=141984 RepID=A0A1W7R994_9SCOR
MNPDTVQVASMSSDDGSVSCHVASLLDETEPYEHSFSYDEVFPALPETEAKLEQPQAILGQWNQKMKVKTSVITQVFRVPVEERKFREFNSQRFGEQGEQAKICAEIMQRTGAHIEISSSKDQSLTILVTGKEEAVLAARRFIVNELQTQAIITISIPKEHHRVILGKNGKRLLELEQSTNTKIMVPRSEENSDLIRITGTKEGTDKARHEIQLISDEQAKMAFERISIPKIFHPFILGPFNSTINQLATETGARINMPPPSVQKDELTIAGEKEAVAKAKECILKIYEEKKMKCQTVSVEVKKEQHKFVIGPRGQTIQEILDQTDVSVEMPSLDSPSETVTLRGEQEKLGSALTLVYAKANSVVTTEVDAPSWLHKFIIGRKGANIRPLTQDFPKVHVQFTDGQDKIKVEGPRGEVEQARKKLEDMTKDLLSKVSCEKMSVDPRYHRHIIGKNGVNINRLKQETGVEIQIPPDNNSSGVIYIEGDPSGVARAKQELLEMVHKMENEVIKEVIMEQRFHRTIIGAKGEKIKEIRDRFNQVNITFPEAGVKSDKVVIRGAKQDVEQCYHYLSQMNKELVTNNFHVEVPVYKQFHKFIIGKGGANIHKIREETHTKIDLPAEGSDSDVITITGKKENVLLAQQLILDKQNELENVVQQDIIIPSKFHNSIIGAKGRLIRSIMEECGGVSIRFPQVESGSDKVSIRGPKEDVIRAKKLLVELSNEKQNAAYTEEIKAKPEHLKFLIGKNGTNVKKIRDRTKARIIFPSEKDDDRESIVIIGKKEEVIQAKKELQEMIKELDKVTELKMKVDQKYHRHFVARRGEVLRQIEEDYGGVVVSFPRIGNNSDEVTVKGPKDSIEGAKQRILEIVDELALMVTMECIIPQKDHRTVMGPRGLKLQAIKSEFNVQIKFPDREIRQDEAFGNQEEMVNGEYNYPLNGPDDRPRKNDIIYITGKKENCQAAHDALLALVPITIDVEIPYDFHRYIIGQKGKDVREMMNKYDVNIEIPRQTEQSDIIKIRGSPANVEEAKAALLERAEQLEEEKRERQLRSYNLTIEVDPNYLPKIIGRKGAVINKIRNDHKVQIQFPERGESNDNVITVIGYEKDAKTARDAILKIVHELDDMITESVEIEKCVHSRLIGSRGRNIRKIMEQYKVEIKFPRPNDPNDPNLVEITGLQENVDDVKDVLLNFAEEYLQDMNESEWMRRYTQPPSRQNNYEGDRPRENRGFIVRGGPWEHRAPVPDTTNTQEFPSFGSGDVPKPVAWGPRR